MSSNLSNDQPRLLPILWGGQLVSVALLLGLTWFLPELMPITPMTALSQALLIAALVAVPVVFALGRWLAPAAPSRPDRYDPLARAPTASTPAARLARELAVLALCEIPAILALVAVLTGADRLQALVIGSAALFLLLGWRPVTRSES